MAEKRKKATGRSQGGGARGGVKRRARAAPAGRTAVRRDTPVARVPAVARAPAMDANSVQVREQIDAAISNAQRMREDIEARIERRFHAELGDTSRAGLLSRTGERFHLGPQPFFIQPPDDDSAPRKRTRKSAR